MGFFDRFKASKRNGGGSGATGFELSRFNSAPPRRGSADLLQAYSTMPWLRAVVEKVADGVAGVQWRVYKPAKRQERPTEGEELRRRSGGPRSATPLPPVNSRRSPTARS
jgi:hypothetical protein